MTPPPPIGAVRFVTGTSDDNPPIEGLLCPYGGFVDHRGQGKDLYGTFFSPRTDFALAWFPSDRPLIYNHGLDAEAGIVPVGRITSVTVRDAGAWMEAQLDASSEYFDAIRELIRQKKLYLSSGAMSHLVDVDARTGEVRRWPIVEGSLTPTPANLLAALAGNLLDQPTAERHYRAVGLDLPAQVLAEQPAPAPALDAAAPSPPGTPTGDGAAANAGGPPPAAAVARIAPAAAGHLRATNAADTTDTTDTPSGVMVGLWLEPLAAAALALPGGEPADLLHLTLCYCGRDEDLGEVVAAQALLAARRIAAEATPLTGRVAGLGRFAASEGSDGLDVIYAAVDVPGLGALREQLAEALANAGAPASTTHGFTPHVTLAYIPPGAPWPLAMPPLIDLSFSSLTFAMGPRRTDLPMLGWGATDAPELMAARTATALQWRLLGLRQRATREGRVLSTATRRVLEEAAAAQEAAVTALRDLLSATAPAEPMNRAAIAARLRLWLLDLPPSLPPPSAPLLPPAPITIAG